jgi:hypothetical protein
MQLLCGALCCRGWRSGQVVYRATTPFHLITVAKPQCGAFSYSIRFAWAQLARKMEAAERQ